MKVHVHYWNQLRAARGVADEVVELEENATVIDLIRTIGESEQLRPLLLDEEGQLLRWILVDRAGTMVRDTSTPLADGDNLQLLTHMSGG